jgi:hypothetical protein
MANYSAYMHPRRYSINLAWPRQFSWRKPQSSKPSCRFHSIQFGVTAAELVTNNLLDVTPATAAEAEHSPPSNSSFMPVLNTFNGMSTTIPGGFQIFSA